MKKLIPLLLSFVLISCIGNSDEKQLLDLEEKPTGIESAEAGDITSNMTDNSAEIKVDNFNKEAIIDNSL